MHPDRRRCTERPSGLAYTDIACTALVSQPVFALAHLLGFDLKPRIRNGKGLAFYRPSKQTEYVHTDALFGEAGKNVIDWDLIESRFRHLMKTAVSLRRGRSPRSPCSSGCARAPRRTPPTPPSTKSAA